MKGTLDDNLLEAIKDTVIGCGYSNPNICIKTISERFNLNRKRLGYNFKKRYGYTINEYVNNLRIERAKRLLEENKYSITSISYIVGFSFGTYFYRVFKNTTG